MENEIITPSTLLSHRTNSYVLQQQPRIAPPPPPPPPIILDPIS